jgi:hypothetical protein
VFRIVIAATLALFVSVPIALANDVAKPKEDAPRLGESQLFQIKTLEEAQKLAIDIDRHRASRCKVYLQNDGDC